MSFRSPPRATALAVVLALLCLAPTGFAQPALSGGGEPAPLPQDLVAVTAAPLPPLAPGAHGVLTLRVTVRDGWHVNANPPSLDYLVPTEVTLRPAAGITAGKPRYPAGKKRNLAFAEVPLSVYEGEFAIEVPITVAADAAAGERALAGTVGFQSCNDQLCLAPAKKPFSMTVRIAPGAAATAPPLVAAAAPPGSAPGPPPGAERATVAPTPAPPAGAGFETGPPPGATAAPATVAANPVARLFQQHGLLAFFSIFLLGLGLNLTPCVYPMMSVTLALFGAREERRLWRRVPPAALYMLGIAITYSLLGLVAAFTGTLFGSALQSPIVLVAIGAVLAVMALSMFGLFEMQLPSGLLTRLGSGGATGLAGVFFSGVMVGLFAAPCVGPPIVALLAVVAQSGNPWFGFGAFFVLSLGLGLPYLVLGTFSGLLQQLPRSGAWMVWVKKLFGVLLLAVAVFYLSLALKPDWSGWVVPAALVLGGLYLGFFAREPGTARAFAWAQRVAGVAAVAVGLWLAISTPRQAIAWEPFTPERLAAVQREGRPVILDFYADWCVPCHELDRSTFTHAEVRRLAGRFATFKVDMTRFESPEASALRQRFAIGGVPTVLFLTPDGREVPGTRVVGFVGPADFATRTRNALTASGLTAQTLP